MACRVISESIRFARVGGSNAVVFGDGCKLAVHQECHGVPIFYSGSQWLCWKCQLYGRGVSVCSQSAAACGSQSNLPFIANNSQKHAFSVAGASSPLASIDSSLAADTAKSSCTRSLSNGKWILLCFFFSSFLLREVARTLAQPMASLRYSFQRSGLHVNVYTLN